AMPVRYRIDPKASLIRTTGSGEVTFQEVLQHFRELEADPGAGGPIEVLPDWSACRSVPTSEQLRAVAGQINALGGRRRFGKCAIVARDDALYGMTRMFEVFVQNHFTATRV